MTAPSNPAEVGAFDPRSEAAYYGSIWQLPTNRIRELEEAFVRAQRSSLPPEAPSLTSSEQLAHTGQSRPLADREMSASPPIREPVAWRWRYDELGWFFGPTEPPPNAVGRSWRGWQCEPLYAAPPIGDTGGVGEVERDRWRANLQAHAAAQRMVREAIEALFGPIASLESDDAVLLRGPEPHHTAEAFIAALQRVAAALVPARVEAVDGWQPIETAPKDGTYIIAYPVLSETACVVVWERAVETPPMMRAKGENIDHSGYWRLPMTGKPTPYQPTHWRTLPAPPALQGNPS